MTEALRRLGFEIEVEPDPVHEANRRIWVRGLGGRIPRAGTLGQPLELFVGNAGTAARFLTALVCLGPGSYRLEGTARMHERPQAELLEALRQLGYHVDSPNDRLPLQVHGAGPRRAEATVSARQSSQFASALLLAAGPAGWTIRVTGENAEESPYVTLTTRLLETFPTTAARWRSRRTRRVAAIS
jgi:3-phosphoshikimate 1-carboxyvinyltransferase